MSWFGFVIVTSIFFVMAGFSCTIELRKFIERIQKPKCILIGLFCQYGLLPFSAFILCKLIRLPPLHSIALILTATCPGGTLSNLFCWVFGADLELSIVMTASSSLLSFLGLSINCSIYIPLVSDSSVQIDYLLLGISVTGVILGVLFGLFMGYKYKITDKYTPLPIKCLIAIGSVAMVLTLLLGAIQNTIISSTPVYALQSKVYTAVSILICISWVFTFTFTHFICRMHRNLCATVCIESANQNIGVSIAILILTLDSESADVAIGIPILYGVFNTITIIIIGAILRITKFIIIDKELNNHNNGLSRLMTYLSVMVCNAKINSDNVEIHEECGEMMTYQSNSDEECGDMMTTITAISQ
eukprot:356847_1